LWFVWDGESLWLNSAEKSQRWTDLERNPAVSAVVDAGQAFSELQGVELLGNVDVVGDVPRSDTPDDVLAGPERLFADKYTSGSFRPDGRHAWLRLRPTKIISWDNRKLGRVQPVEG
jgi:hypothetical protein